MTWWTVKSTGTAWVEAIATVEADDKAEAERFAHEKFDDLEWTIVEMDRPVIAEVEATNICSPPKELS